MRSYVNVFILLPLLLVGGTALRPGIKANAPANTIAAKPGTDLKDGLAFLNLVRQNPAKYGTEFGIDLSAMKPNIALTWNDTLAKVAQAKAMDMATRGYFDHVDPDGNGMNIKIAEAGYSLLQSWTTPRSQNYFESLGAGYRDINDAIKNLIIDAGTPSLGHRLHLLGQGDFWNNCYDIGIGEARVSGAPYSSYYSFIIAKHKF
ncbi:CAP domain-containing protein [Mucilaginibacter flavidus]|uniref:CAP domain-containing protein n=1 Tax=Mucilaginibacter flavidus TaxID=2949309 RepID=UPI002093D91F|nr:CAP domain-containing protein [Mucilaginibacter flavidus]MCO5945384.1 CAP domain-containing protein [Mucilaginibacter flavidus]